MGSEPTETTHDGTQIWRNENGDRHREDGPATIYPDGRRFWYINGKHHREDGPAAIYPDGEQHWCINGKRHREDGPAVIYPNGGKYWYINDHDITDEIRKWAKNRDIDLNNLTEMDKMIISFEWGDYGK